ncbi:MULTISPECIES: phosphotransferase [Luteimonas]|uniref:phosphotransferase n=1 Tax=Luteimonas TaxID=83614 RepID=UPI000C7DC11A|nr:MULTISPECIES: phosphotransferase [Luteimonas]
MSAQDAVAIDRAALMAMIPHQDAMCLWDAVVDWDAQRVQLRSTTHRDAAHPLRSDGRLRALHLCEYGAQAMAVHGGLRARDTGASPRTGMLVALRGVQLHVDRLDALTGDLVCTAEVLIESADSQQYAFRIECDGVLLAEGRAAVMLGAAQGAP